MQQKFSRQVNVSYLHFKMKKFDIFAPCSVNTALTVTKNYGWHITVKCFNIVVKAQTQSKNVKSKKKNRHGRTHTFRHGRTQVS